jgi:hypothetical protein
MAGLMEFRIGQLRRNEDLEAYREGWDRIFGERNDGDEERECGEQREENHE